MKGGVILFARMNSSRLPGKALLPLGGMPLVERVSQRASYTGYPVFLATSNETDDDILADWAKQNNVPCFRGNKNNVLSRAVEAARFFELDFFARLCGDRPLFFVEEMKAALDLMGGSWQNPLCPELITNFQTENRIPGLMTEVISTKVLASILNQPALNAHFVEHLTSYLYEYSARYKILHIPSQIGKRALTSYAIDTEAEYHRQKTVFDRNPLLSLTLDQFDACYLAKLD